MAFQIVGGLNTISNFGKDYSAYEEASKQTKAALWKLGKIKRKISSLISNRKAA